MYISQMTQSIISICKLPHEWMCPYCGRTKKTRKNNAPNCKGSNKPQDWDFHLFRYRMQRVVQL